MDFLDQLNALENRYRSTLKMLSDPCIINDVERMQELAKESAKLEEVVDLFENYKKCIKEEEESRALLLEGDDELKQLAREELVRLEEAKGQLENRLKLSILPKDPNDEKGVILEIRAGTGGEEAALFASDLSRMYLRYAEDEGWKKEIMNSSETGSGGFKEIIMSISGGGVYSKLKYESGVHRVQRVPATEASGRIHTSTATVAVLPEAEEVDVDINLEDLRVDVFRSSGPGGQSVNTTDSAVRITHLPTGIVVTCQDEKSQHKNKTKALKILRSRLLDLAIVERDKEISESRKKQVGTAERSERIRTYNFPQGRVTDHRINLTLYNIDQILAGNIDEIVAALQLHYQALTLGDNFQGSVVA